MQTEGPAGQRPGRFATLRALPVPERRMNVDTTTRLLLAGILLCLTVLIVQGLGSCGGGTEIGRYQVSSMNAGTPLLIRTDTVTGQVWKSEIRGGRGSWVAFDNPAAGDAGAASDESAELALPEPPARPAPSVAVASPERGPETPALGPGAALVPPTPRVPSEPPATADQNFDQLVKAVQRRQLPPDIRVWAVRRLAGIDDPRVVDVLLGSLEDGEPRVVAAAVEGLSARDDARIRPAIEKLRDHPDPTVQAAVQAHLGG